MTKIMKYKATHPWITFRVDLSQTDPRLWLDLGEAASKIEHLAGVPLRPSVAEHLHQIYLAKGAAATTAIEGNTLTEAQVLQHVRGDLHLPESQEYLQQEVDNIAQACNQIIEHLVGPGQNPAISPALLCQYNRQVRQGLAEDEGISAPGKLRTESVLVGGVYREAPAADCQFLVDRFANGSMGHNFSHRATLPGTVAKTRKVKAGSPTKATGVMLDSGFRRAKRGQTDKLKNAL